MEQAISSIRNLIINTPSAVPVSRDSEFIRDIEDLLLKAKEIARKYSISN
jgi:hypothetical protein